MRIGRSRVVWAIMAALAALAAGACHGPRKSADQRSAAGEVLAGSISDAMIPYEKLKSQPPLAPEGGVSGASAADDASDDAGSSASEIAPAAPAPGPSETSSPTGQ